MGKGLLTSALISFEFVQARECIRGLCADTKTKRFWNLQFLSRNMIHKDHCLHPHVFGPHLTCSWSRFEWTPANAGRISQIESGWHSPCSRREQGNYAKWPCSGHRNLVIAHPLCVFFWLICMGHRTNRDAWVDARRQAGHEVVVDAAPAEKPGTEQDWWRAVHWDFWGRSGTRLGLEMREPHTWLTMKLDTVPKACFHFLGGPAILAQCLNTFEALWVCVFVRVPFTLILLSPPIGTCWDMLEFQVQTNLKHLETHSLQQFAYTDWLWNVFEPGHEFLPLA